MKAPLTKKGVFLYIWLVLDKAFSIVKICELPPLKINFENMSDAVNKHTDNIVNKNWLL